jgi:hypothetical protein
MLAMSEPQILQLPQLFALHRGFIPCNLSGLYSGVSKFPPSLRKALPVSRGRPQCEAGNESLTDARGAPRRRVDDLEGLDDIEDTKPAAQEL